MQVTRQKAGIVEVTSRSGKERKKIAWLGQLVYNLKEKGNIL